MGSPKFSITNLRILFSFAFASARVFDIMGWGCMGIGRPKPLRPNDLEAICNSCISWGLIGVGVNCITILVLIRPTKLIWKGGSNATLGDYNAF